MLTKAQSTEQFLSQYVNRLREVVPVRTGALQKSLSVISYDEPTSTRFNVEVGGLYYLKYVDARRNFIAQADPVIDNWVKEYMDIIANEEMDKILNDIFK